MSQYLVNLNNIRFIRFGHLVLAPALVFSLYCFSDGEVNWWLVFLGFFLFDSLGVEVGAHKLFSHRSFTTNVYMEGLLGFFCVLSGQGSPIVWGAIHSGLHHRHTDGDKDPHSPEKGFFHSFIAWYWRIERVPIRFVASFLRNPYLKFVHRYHTVLFWFVWLAAIVFIDFSSFISFFVIPVILSNTLTGLMSYFLHRENNDFFDMLLLTYRPHESRDNSKNSLILGFLSFGTGFHNNHHMYPRKYDSGIRWFEIDLSICLRPFFKDIQS